MQICIEAWQQCPHYQNDAYLLLCSHRLKPWSREVFDRSLTHNFALFAHNHQALLGYVIYSCVAGELEIEDICCHPQFRQQGVAKALLEQLGQMAKQNAVEYLLLEVNAQNHPAISLYQQTGFEALGLRKDYYQLADGKFADAIVMKKDLN